jgi:dethiobiotin synthetase
MPRFVVVTATDTGVGKTLVSAGLARAFRAMGKRIVAIKPFETGLLDGERGDGEALAEAAGQDEPRSALVRLRDPLTPALAAEREGIEIDFDAVTARIRALGEPADIAIIEGAGGVLSPLTWTADITTLARKLGADRVVLVASDRLGTLSAVHTAVQTLLDCWQLPEAIILSAPAAPDLSTGTNAAVLRRRLAPYGKAIDDILELPRVPDPEHAATALAVLAAKLAAT